MHGHPACSRNPMASPDADPSVVESHADDNGEGDVSFKAFTRDVVVLGASAGGVPTLQRLMGTIPGDYPGALFVVVHVSPEVKSELPSILTRAGRLVAARAEDGMPIESGAVYVAPPDHHLLLEPERMRVTHGPRENRHRPAIDPLFRSAAWAFGPRVVGVVLSGGLDDGTAGLWSIKSCGGTTVVQEPSEALYPEMPNNALLYNRVDYRLLLTDIGPLLDRLAREPIEGWYPTRPPASLQREIAFAGLNGNMADVAALGRPSAFTCPACGGALWEIDEGSHLRYRCHTGHAFSPASLLVEQGSVAEQRLYTALRVVREKSAALRRLAAQWPESGSPMRVDYERRASELDAAADTLRRLLAGDAL